MGGTAHAHKIIGGVDEREVRRIRPEPPSSALEVNCPAHAMAPPKPIISSA